MVTLTVFSQPPDFAILFNKPGKKAPRAKGNAMESPNPKKPTTPPRLLPDFTMYTISELMNAEVQLKDTTTSTNAMKKIPPKLLELALESSCLKKE